MINQCESIFQALEARGETLAAFLQPEVTSKQISDLLTVGRCASISCGQPNEADFWKNKVNLDGSYTHYSGLGSRCKVEVISKTDLLRARGFEV